jgi:O-antigen/teichoic acid export membrane protein
MMLLKLTKLLISNIGEIYTEVINIATSKEKLRQVLHVSLYSNAFYLMVASATTAVFGFAFWLIAARFYPAEAVGLASAVIAAMGLLASFANLGIGYGLIRFLPHSDAKANNLLNSSFTISILASLLASLIFLSGLGFWSTALLFLRQEPLLIAAFVVFTIAFTLGATAGEALIAERRAGFLLVRGVIFNVLRLSLVILLVGAFHSFGIFGSWGISLWVALLFNIFLFLPRVQIGYRPRPTISKEINEMIHFSFGNYIANLLRGAPSLILPIMVINLLGAELTAYFSIASMIGGTLGTVAENTSMSLFAEGSYEEEKLGLNVRRSLKLILLILVPTVILALAFADKLLLAFGSPYSESATTLLRILILSTLPLAVNTVYLFVKRVEKKLNILIAVYAFIAVITLALTYILLPTMGITGAGIAWLSSNGVVAVVIATSFIKRRLTDRKGAS